MKVIDQLTRLATILLSLASLAQGYLNPIVPGMNPDPSILRDGDDYWLIVTSLEFTPGIPIYHSRDLIDWKLHSHALTRPSQLTLFGTPSSLGKLHLNQHDTHHSSPDCVGIWASTIRKHKSRYYISSGKKVSSLYVRRGNSHVQQPHMRIFSQMSGPKGSTYGPMTLNLGGGQTQSISTLLDSTKISFLMTRTVETRSI